MAQINFSSLSLIAFCTWIYFSQSVDPSNNLFTGQSAFTLVDKFARHFGQLGFLLILTNLSSLVSPFLMNEEVSKVIYILPLFLFSIYSFFMTLIEGFAFLANYRILAPYFLPILGAYGFYLSVLLGAILYSFHVLGLIEKQRFFVFFENIVKLNK